MGFPGSISTLPVAFNFNSQLERTPYYAEEVTEGTSGPQAAGQAT